MAAGLGCTVTVAVVIQPVPGNVYVTIQVPDPGPPVTVPPIDTVAMPGQEPLHVPPPPLLGWVSVVDAPIHTDMVPTGAGATGNTFTVSTLKQVGLKK